MSDARHRGASKLNCVFVATAEVATPVASGMAIIALVFLPLLTLEGLEGKLFAPVAMTIVLSLISALMLSLTLVPVLAFYLFGREAESHHEPWLMRQLTPRYERLLDASFAHKPRVFIGRWRLPCCWRAEPTAVTGKTFLPTMDEGSIIVQLTKLPSIGIEHSTAGDMKVQKRAAEGCARDGGRDCARWQRRAWARSDEPQ